MSVPCTEVSRAAAVRGGSIEGHSFAFVGGGAESIFARGAWRLDEL